MATPTYPSKRYYAAGAIKCANWGTANAVGANTGLLLLGDSGIARNQKFEPYPAIDQIIPKDGILGISEPVELSPPLNLQYEMGPVGAMIAGFFGTAGAPANVDDVFKHTFQWANSANVSFTYCEERPGHVWEVPSAMPYKVVFSPDGAQIKAGVTLRGNTLVDDSTVNNNSTMDAITYVSRATFLHFSHGQFLLNAENGATLSANNDAVEISDFEVSLERSIDSVHVAGSVNIAEPVEGDIPNCTLKVTLPRASNTNVDYFSSWEDMSPKKAKLTFTGALAGNNTYYSVSLLFPKLMLISPPDVKMDGVIKNELTFSMLEGVANAANGMNYTRPYMEIVNTANADYLA